MEGAPVTVKEKARATPGRRVLALAILGAFIASGYLLGIAGWGRPAAPVYEHRRLRVGADRLEMWLRREREGPAPALYVVFRQGEGARGVGFDPARPEVLDWPGRGRVVLPPRRPVILACADGRVRTHGLETVWGPVRQYLRDPGQGVRLHQRLERLARP